MVNTVIFTTFNYNLQGVEDSILKHYIRKSVHKICKIEPPIEDSKNYTLHRIVIKVTVYLPCIHRSFPFYQFWYLKIHVYRSYRDRNLIKDMKTLFSVKQKDNLGKLVKGVIDNRYPCGSFNKVNKEVITD